MNGKSLLIATLALLEREGTVSIPQLARLLGASEENVWDALEVLVFCYDAVSVRLDLHDAYATLEGGGDGQLLRLNGDETEILLDALQAQGFSADDGLCRKLLEAKGLLAKEGAGDGDGGDAADGRTVRMQTVNEGNVAGIMETVARACDDPEHHLLAIEYQKEGASNAGRRVVEPYSLVSDGDHRYLQAYCRKAGGWRSFRTDRIRRAELLEETYEPRGDAPEMMEERKTTSRRARVRFAPGTPLPTWNGLRKTRELADGAVEATVPWLGGLWLPKHIVALFGRAVPLDPPELVDATRAYAETLLSEI